MGVIDFHGWVLLTSMVVSLHALHVKIVSSYAGYIPHAGNLWNHRSINTSIPGPSYVGTGSIQAATVFDSMT